MKLNLSKLRSSFKIFRYGDQLNPSRDWFLLVSVAGILLAASIAWNAWLFLRVTNGDAIGTATVQQALNPASIDSVNALFQARANTEADYKNAHFVDPSVPAS